MYVSIFAGIRTCLCVPNFCNARSIAPCCPTLLPAQCHLLGNGYSEVALTFGRGHTCGTAPERVANQIRDSVAARAAAYPDCFKAGSLVPPPPRPPPPPVSPPPPAAPSPPPAQGTW